MEDPTPVDQVEVEEEATENPPIQTLAEQWKEYSDIAYNGWETMHPVQYREVYQSFLAGALEGLHNMLHIIHDAVDRHDGSERLTVYHQEIVAELEKVMEMRKADRVKNNMKLIQKFTGRVGQA